MGDGPRCRRSTRRGGQGGIEGQPLERFVRRLALECNRPDFRRFVEEIDIEEIVGWLAFWHVEPFGEHWRQAARTAVTVASAIGKVNDNMEDMFLPNYRVDEDVQSDEEMAAVLATVPQFADQMRRQGVIR